MLERPPYKRPRRVLEIIVHTLPFSVERNPQRRNPLLSDIGGKPGTIDRESPTDFCHLLSICLKKNHPAPPPPLHIQYPGEIRRGRPI